MNSKGYGAILFVIIMAFSLLGFLIASSKQYIEVQQKLIQYMNKEQSFLFAKSCRNIALLYLAENPSLIVTEDVAIHLGSIICSIKNISLDTTNKSQSTSTIWYKIVKTYGANNGEETILQTSVQGTLFGIQLISTIEK